MTSVKSEVRQKPKNRYTVDHTVLLLFGNKKTDSRYSEFNWVIIGIQSREEFSCLEKPYYFPKPVKG